MLFWGIFSPASIRDTIIAIQDLYGACGYIDTAVDVQLSLREDCPVYDVTFQIEEGNQYCIGMVRVFGNYSTQSRVILHENLLCPGDIFDLRKVEATEERLVNTGFFNSVNVYAVRSQTESDDSCYRDVFIEVEEADTGNIGIFFGFSSIDRLFGGIDLTERNFNIAGIPGLFRRGPHSLRGAGEYLYLKANIGDKMTTYFAQWTKPYFLDTPWALGIDVERSNNRSISEAYELKTYGGNVHATYILNAFMKYDFYYRAIHTRNSFRDNTSLLLNEEAGITGFVSALGGAFVYDSTDSPRRPTYGFRSRFITEVAGVGGNFQFVKFLYMNSYYFPVTARGTYKVRADLQFIKTYGHTNPKDLPLSERFFVGGETTVRGYRPYAIGPKFGNNEPRGGVSCYLLTQEYQHNLLRVPPVDAFAFCDAGYLSLSEFTVGRPAVSVGFGLRFELMRNAPMTVGLGWPIHPFEDFKDENGFVQRLNNAQRFFFAMGANF